MSALMDALGSVADVLSTPGGLVRGLLAGRPGEQASGHELLSQYGLDPGDGLGGTVAGIGVDVATDPLTYAGGALARALLGGKLRPVQTAVEGGPLGLERDVMPLVPPFESTAGRLRPRVVHMAEEVPEPSLSGAAGLEGRAAQAAPPPDLLDRLYHPDEVGHIIGYGPDLTRYAPALDRFGTQTASIPGDFLQEGDKLGAFKAALTGWDQVLADLERLAPEARNHLGVGDGAAPMSEIGRYWQDAMGWRAGDLQAASSLRGGIPGFAELEPSITAQLARLNSLRGPGYHSLGGRDGTALQAIRDIETGTYLPGRVGEDVADYLGHLPVDPRFLKGMAMRGQRQAVERELPESLDHIAALVAEHGGLDALGQANSNGWMNNWLVQQIGNLVRPEAFAAEHGFEPNIARAVFSRPPLDEGQAATLAELRAAFARLAERPPGPAAHGPAYGWGADDHLTQLG